MMLAIMSGRLRILIKSSPVINRVDQYNPAQLGISPKVNISNEAYLTKRNKFLDTTRDIPPRAPTQGTINNIVIFIRSSVILNLTN